MGNFRMKAATCLGLILVLGCANLTKVVIPPEPKFRQTIVYTLEEGIFMDNENLKIFVENLRLLKDHCNELRKLLEKEGK